MANKKAYILYVLKILEEHSDEHNLITHQQIIDYAKAEYNVDMERKAVANCIDILSNPPFDYDINKGNDKNSRKGFYLGERLLDANDVLYLNNYLLSARNVPATFAKRISSSLINTLSEHYRKNFHEIYFMDKVDRTPNKHLSYVIDEIAHALRHNHKITFKYYEYDMNGNLVPRLKDNEERIYTVSPYYLYNSLGKFYLLSMMDNKDNELIPFRVEFIDNVIELKDKVVPLSNIKGYKNFDISEYINTHPYATGDNTQVEVKLEVLHPSNGIRYIKDWYGNSATFKKEKDKCIATIKTTYNAAFWWIMQYSEHYNLLSPKELIKKTRDAATRILKEYK